MRPTVRTERSGRARRLQIRNSPASGWRFWRWYTATITGNHTFRGHWGPRLRPMSPAKCSVSKRAIHRSTVGREILQKPAETHLIPALVVQSDNLQASVAAIGMGAIVPPWRRLRRGDGALVPQLLDRVVMDGVAEGEEQDAGEFAVMKAGVERFEPVNLLADGIGNPCGSAAGRHLEVRGHQPQHALPVEAALEGADGVRMGLRFLGPLRGRPIGKQHERADHLIAPLDLIDEAQLQLRKRRGRFHRSPFTRAAGEGLM